MNIVAEREERIKRDADFFDRMQSLVQKVVEGKTDRDVLRAEAAVIMQDIYKAEYQSAWRDVFEHAFGPIGQFDLEAVAS